MQSIRLTIRETSQSINRQFGGRPVPDWKLRRVVDDLDSRGMICVQRMGTYRTIASDEVTTIATELQRIGWLNNERESALC